MVLSVLRWALPALLCFILAVLGFIIGKNRLTCNSCEKSHLLISTEEWACCPYCGAPYFSED